MRESSRRQHLTTDELRQSVSYTGRALARLDGLIRAAQDLDSPLLATSVAACMEAHAQALLSLAADHRSALAEATDMEAEVRFDLAHLPIAHDGGDLLSGGPLWWEEGHADAAQGWFWSVVTPTPEEEEGGR